MECLHTVKAHLCPLSAIKWRLPAICCLSINPFMHLYIHYINTTTLGRCLFKGLDNLIMYLVNTKAAVMMGPALVCEAIMYIVPTYVP